MSLSAAETVEPDTMSRELDAFRGMIGSEAPPVRYAVSAASMAYFADSLMDTDPRYRGVHPHAPPVFFGSALDLVDLPAGDFRSMFGLQVPLRSDWTVVATGDEFEFYAPVVPGMVLTCRERFVDAYEKMGRSGRLIFFTVEKVFTEEDGTTVLRRGIACAARERGPLSSAGRDRLHAEEAGAGSALPSLVVGPVTVRYLAMFATATAEFVDIHYDADYARSVGLPGPIVQGLYKTALIGQMLARSTGAAGRITRLSVQHRGIDAAGSILTAEGRTKRPAPIIGRGCAVEYEVCVRNHSGRVTTHGTALVSPCVSSRPQRATQ